MFKTLLNEEKLRQYGIVDWGVVFESSPSSYQRFLEWVNSGAAGKLKYLTDNRSQIRSNLKNIFPPFKSAIVFLFNYAPERHELNNFYQTPESNGLKIASYVFSHGGEDYHQRIKDSLDQIGSNIQEENSEVQLISAVDTMPILERDLAYQAGLGWFGKNSMLIHRKHGSFFLIGGLLTNIEPNELRSFKKPLEVDHCGQCNKCVEACPTQAINPSNRTLYADKCISTFTIETFKMENPPAGHHLFPEIFGCDICQDVCPWNDRPLRLGLEGRDPFANALGSEIKEFFLKKSLNHIKEQLQKMSNRFYRNKFKNTCLERTGREGLLKNLKV